MDGLPLRKLLVLVFIFFVIFDLVLLGIYLYKTSSIEKPGFCLMLEEKYCKIGKPIYKKEKLVFVGFKLPEDTSIFAPFGGYVSNTPTFFVKKGEDYVTYPGISVDIREEDGKYTKRSFSAVYFEAKREDKVISDRVKKGEVIGYVSGKILSEYGDYNLLVSFSEFDEEKKMLSVDEVFLKDLFQL